jgi:hypothetical protein
MKSWFRGYDVYERFVLAAGAQTGYGRGGINMPANLIISDIVLLQERGHFMAILLAAVMVGTGIGPFVGGYCSKYQLAMGVLVEPSRWWSSTRTRGSISEGQLRQGIDSCGEAQTDRLCRQYHLRRTKHQLNMSSLLLQIAIIRIRIRSLLSQWSRHFRYQQFRFLVRRKQL